MVKLKAQPQAEVKMKVRLMAKAKMKVWLMVKVMVQPRFLRSYLVVK